MQKIEKIPISDLHCDTAIEILAGKSLAGNQTQVNLDELEKANVKIQVFACYVSPVTAKGSRFPLLMQMISALKQEIEKESHRIELCLTADEIKKANSRGKIAAILAVENGMALENNLYNLKTIYDEGVRLLTIVHSASSEWAISSNDANPAFDGLTDFGVKIIESMNNLGMAIDVSHAHKLTVQKVLDISDRPIVASHSCAAALCPVARNLTDEEIEAIASKGGMIGVNFFPGFLDYDYHQTLTTNCGDLFAKLDEMEIAAKGDPQKISAAFRDYRKLFREQMNGKNVSIEVLVDHIEHIRKIGGDEAVGFGSDFDGVPDLPKEIKSVADLPKILELMNERGIPLNTIEKIAYGNFLSFFAKAIG